MLAVLLVWLAWLVSMALSAFAPPAWSPAGTYRSGDSTLELCEDGSLYARTCNGWKGAHYRGTWTYDRVTRQLCIRCRRQISGRILERFRNYLVSQGWTREAVDELDVPLQEATIYAHAETGLVVDFLAHGGGLYTRDP